MKKTSFFHKCEFIIFNLTQKLRYIKKYFNFALYKFIKNLKMKKYFIFSVVFILTSFLVISCGNTNNDNKTNNTDSTKTEQKIAEDTIVPNSNLVLIETEFGNMKVKLYNKTPKHKANFLKLANNGFFNDLLFHRVIKDFMIQGGDPQSKNAAPNVMLGNGGPGYQIDAEFNDSLFHKKGALAAAREGDQVNPLKKSSGSQFYIVQGKKYTDEELDNMETQFSLNDYIANHPEIQEQIATLQGAQDRDGINKLIEDVKKKKDFVINKIPNFKRKIYKEVGGTPFLDNSYTVFGEVIEGLEVIDKIADVKTAQGDRPVKDVKMTIKIIEE